MLVSISKMMCSSASFGPLDNDTQFTAIMERDLEVGTQM